MVRLLLLSPLLVLVLAFALSNRDAVVLGLWPTDYTVALPTSLAMLAALAAGLVLGAAAMGPGLVRQRRRARRAERSLRLLETAPVAVPPPPSAPQPALSPPTLDG